jgi:hypothetical protein
VIHVDPFDPNLIAAPQVCFLQLSDRFDVYAMLDPIDYEWARQWKWCHTYGSGSMVEVAEGVFAIERPDHIYARRCVGSTTLFLHREILRRKDGEPRYKRAIGDHINGETLNCRRNNLRWATPRMNARNKAGSRTRARLIRQMGAP